mgnify:CR=1 FL=1
MTTPPKGAFQCHLQIDTIFLTFESLRESAIAADIYFKTILW